MLIETRNLTKKYGFQTVVSELNLSLEKGKIYALLGPNGSGKTTLMKMIIGLVKPTMGEISYCGMPIGIASKEKIAYMPTEAFFYPYMTAKQLGTYFQDFFSDFEMARYEQLLDQMQLDPEKKARDLSSGLLAKLKVAVTLARRAELYLLDEPLNGIDLLAREAIISAILETVRPDMTFVISSHLIEELEKMVERVIFIKDGSICFAGDAEELREAKGKSMVDFYKEIYRE